MWDSAEATNQVKFLGGFPGGRGVRGSFNLHFSLKCLLSQNHQVHTLVKMGIPPEEDPGTSSFYSSRDNPDLLPSFLPLPERDR